MKKVDLEHLSTKERADAKNEVAVLRVLKHPNVVCHHESFIHDSQLCIVMEYADGGSSRRCLRAGAVVASAALWSRG